MSKRIKPKHKEQISKRLDTIIRTKLSGKVSEKEMVGIVSDLKRFVRVAHKITTEPQFQTYYKESTQDGKQIKRKVVETDISEFKKTKKGKKRISITEAFQNLEKTVEKNEK